jgi:GNAT superfamily N-acetyltransferase
MSGSKNALIPITESLEETGGRLLARAFIDDPMLKVVFPDRGKRGNVLPNLMTATLRYFLRIGESVMTRDHNALACWTKTTRNTFSISAAARAGMFDIPFQIGLSATRKFMGIEAETGKLHKRIVRKEHIYLEFLAVDPESQGKGWGSVILKHLQAKAKETDHSIYLETTNPGAKTFYQANGFALGKEILSKQGFKIWGMFWLPE